VAPLHATSTAAATASPSHVFDLLGLRCRDDGDEAVLGRVAGRGRELPRPVLWQHQFWIDRLVRGGFSVLPTRVGRALSPRHGQAGLAALDESGRDPQGDVSVKSVQTSAKQRGTPCHDISGDCLLWKKSICAVIGDCSSFWQDQSRFVSRGIICACVHCVVGWVGGYLHCSSRRTGRRDSQDLYGIWSGGDQQHRPTNQARRVRIVQSSCGCFSSTSGYQSRSNNALVQFGPPNTRAIS
jgi:hypothetical protein